MKVSYFSKRALLSALVLIIILSLLTSCAPAQKAKPANENLILSTTTSTQDSGLLDGLIPIFEEEYGYKVKVVAVGSGEAIQMGKDGNADVLLVHSPADEETFMNEGFAGERLAVMHNDYVLLGPENDPAHVKGMKVAEAFKAALDKGAVFVSRADNSGTHKKELKIWAEVGVTPSGANYLESGQGMGDSLTLASEKGAYILADRGTYLSMKGSLSLVILTEGENILFNPYHVMTLNKAKFDKVNHEGAADFVKFITDPKTQDFISKFGTGEFGQPLFYPDAA